MTSTGLFRRNANDLWKRATDTLSNEDRNNINVDGPDKLNILKDVQILTQKAQEECIGRRWRYTRKNGETVMVIDLFGKVIKWMDLFKQVGDTVVQYDPVHAALPWAGVRFLLQVAVNDSRKFAFLIDSASSIAEMICRCALLEDFYLQSTSIAVDELKKSLVELYATIMIYLSKTKSYFNENTAERIIKSGILAQSDHDSFFAAIFTAQEKVDRYSKLVERQDQIVNYNELKILRQAFDTPLKQLTHGFRSVNDNIQKYRLQEIYNWLSPLAGLFDKKQQDVFHLESRQDGLGNWLQGTTEYKQWLSGIGETLCCYGKPGVGKTVLSSFIIDHLQKDPPISEIGVAYIYCDYNQAQNLTAVNLVASLLHQLVRTRDILQRELTSLYNEHIKKQTPPLLDECAKLLQSAINHFPKVYIVIDALDECLEAGRVREDFLDAISTLDRVNVLITSRVMPTEEPLQGARHINIQAVHADIERYIEERASKSNRIRNFTRKDPDLVETIKATILEKSKGMFLLAFLHMESLVTKNDLRSLKDAMKLLPKGLDSAYDKIMERIQTRSDDDRDLATKVLSWIMYASRPLTLNELHTALAIRVGDKDLDTDGYTDENRLLATCAGIVSIRRESNTIVLVHYTAEEYLRGKGDRYFPEAQAQITNTCLTYLMFDSFQEGPCRSDPELKQRFQKHCFLRYAAQFWGIHFGKDLKQQAKPLALKFLEEPSKVSCSIQVIHNKIRRSQGDQTTRHERFRESQQRLHNIHCLWLAAFFNMTEVIQELLKNGTNVLMKTGYGESALHAAARRGNSNALELLLKAGGDVNAINESLNSPLSIAVSYLDNRREDISRYEDVIYLLIENGADVAFRDNNGWTPLNSASSNGYIDVVKMLLEKGADITVPNKEGCTPLYSASSNGHIDVVKMLLEKGADMTIPNNDGWTPLNAASDNGHIDVVKMLLKKGADMTIPNNDRWTPLNAASDNGYIDVVKMLLKKGANITVPNKEGWTPLNAASNNGHIGVVKILLEKGAGMTIPNKEGCTPLYSASCRGHVNVVKMLLEKGADMTIPNNDGWTPLNAASDNGHIDIVKILVENEKGADITVPNKEGWTPLYSASDNGHIDVVKILLEKGADMTIPNKEGCTPLYSASCRGHVNVVKILLEKGANMTIPNNDGWTPLNAASDNGHIDVVKMLLKKGADITVPNKEGWTPLNSASDSGYIDVVKILLENEKGADITVPNKEGWTPLYSASCRGHVNIVKILLEKGADMTIPNNDGWTPLNAASDNGHINVVKMLLEKGADITVPNKEGWTPLNSASDSGYIDIVKILLKKGADMTIPNKEGWTPLYSASNSGHVDVVKLLLENGADMTTADEAGCVPILVAAEKGHESIINLLLEYFDLSKFTPNVLVDLLHASAYGGCFSLLRLIIEQHQVDYNQTDIQERNAAHFAARGGHFDILEYLLAMGTNSSRVDVEGNSILHYAASGASFDVVQKTIPFHIKTPACHNTWSPLHWACRSSSAAVVNLLLENGLRKSVVTTTDPDGNWTPYSIAVFHQNKNLLRDLGKGTHRLSSVDLDALGFLSSDGSLEAKKHGSYWCNRCKHDIYGARFHCLDCVGFDYCFMCKLNSHLTHPNHKFEVVLPED